MDIPRVPASAGLLLEAIWFRSFTLVCSKISQTLFAINIESLVEELSHCNSLVLSVHMKTLLNFTVRASSAACNSSFGYVINFIGPTRGLPRTNASSVWCQLEVVTRAQRNATPLKTSCELSPNMCSSRCSKLPKNSSSV